MAPKKLAAPKSSILSFFGSDSKKKNESDEDSGEGSDDDDKKKDKKSKKGGNDSDNDGEGMSIPAVPRTIVHSAHLITCVFVCFGV